MDARVSSNSSTSLALTDLNRLAMASELVGPLWSCRVWRTTVICSRSFLGHAAFAGAFSLGFALALLFDSPPFFLSAPDAW